MPEKTEALARVRFRDARLEDLEAIVRLLAEDSLGNWRGSLADGDLPEACRSAFDAIGRDPNNRIIVGDLDGRTVACLQLTFIPGLAYSGGVRAQIEGVRVDKDLRGLGIGRALIEHSVSIARERPCVLVQLTTDKRRSEALAFYQALGFTASHDGMKLRF